METALQEKKIMLRGFRGEEKDEGWTWPQFAPPTLLSYINLNLQAHESSLQQRSLWRKSSVCHVHSGSGVLYIWIFICMRYARGEANNKYAAKVEMRSVFSATPSASLLGHTHCTRRRALEVCMNHSAPGRGRMLNPGGRGRGGTPYVYFLFKRRCPSLAHPPLQYAASLLKTY